MGAQLSINNSIPDEQATGSKGMKYIPDTHMKPHRPLLPAPITKSKQVQKWSKLLVAERAVKQG